MFYGRSFQAFRGRLLGWQEQGGDKVPCCQHLPPAASFQLWKQTGRWSQQSWSKRHCFMPVSRPQQPQHTVGPRTASAKTTITLRCRGWACHKQSPLSLLLGNCHILHSPPGTSVLRENGRGGCYAERVEYPCVFLPRHPWDANA